MEKREELKGTFVSIGVAVEKVPAISRGKAENLPLPTVSQCIPIIFNKKRLMPRNRGGSSQ